MRTDRALHLAWAGYVLAAFAAVGCGDGRSTDAQSAEHAGEAGRTDGETGGKGGADASKQGGAAGDQASGSAGDAGRQEECVDEYPFDDGYTCEQQAGWGKCDESWLQGYCLLSCDRCDWEPEPQIDMGGARDVFEEYSEKAPLAPTPPMGWNSWNKFGCDIDEQLVMETADSMVSSGMREAGYEYVNIDDCWQAEERLEDGSLAPDPERFPSGMQALADYVHGLDLKIGIYSDRGTETCGGFPGSYDHELQDARTFAEWGIDYLKYDNCSVPYGRESGAEMEEDYAIMGEALRQSGRDIVYSICAWWFRDWMPEVGHLWRTTTDIKDVWSDDHHSVISLLDWSGGDTDRYGEFSEDDYESGAYAPPGLARYAGPHGWNDPDMLEVGNGGMTDSEYRSHFSLWALMAAPLLAGNDLRDMDEATIDILTNPEVLAVNQDSLGAQGVPVSESTKLEVWAKPLSSDDTVAVILFNRTEEAAEITAVFAEIGLEASTAEARDLWAHEDLGSFEHEFTAEVAAHGVVMVTLVGK